MDDEGAIDASEENALAMQTKLGNIHFLLFIPSFTLYVLPHFFLLLSLPSSHTYLITSLQQLFTLRPRGRGETRGH